VITRKHDRLSAIVPFVALALVTALPAQTGGQRSRATQQGRRLDTSAIQRNARQGNRQNRQGDRQGDRQGNRQGNRGQFQGRRGQRGNQQPERAPITVYASKTDLIGDLELRQVGPANHSGRIVDIAVDPRDRTTFYVAAATGGLWKTTNKGMTFTPVFDKAGTTSIGDVAIAPSKPDVLYLGTGEANNQRSSYWGDGVYRSIDGGKSWQNVGLRDSHHIGRIIVDPNNHKRVFVAALGHLYTPNEQRGLYKSTDAGNTWKRVLSAGPDVGVVDVAMHPTNSQVLIAATYERRRRAWNFTESGPGSAVWRSEDGGESWTKITEGLPSGKIGRIGIAFAPSKPDRVYVLVENANQAPPDRRRVEPAPDPDPDAAFDPDEEEAPQGRRRGPRTVGGEVYRSDDAGKTWKKMTSRPTGGSPHYYYGQIRVDPNDADKVFVVGMRISVSTDGGKKFNARGFANGVHVDNHALWIDPSDSDHILIGNDGGFAETFDAGKNFIHYENLPVGQYYAVCVDMREPYNIYGGTQDNGSWGIPSQGPTSRGARIRDCFKISGGDGFYTVVDPEDPNTVYSESQFGGIQRVDLRTMRRRSIRPRPRRGEPGYRFNWCSPILVSPHNHATVYFGGNKLFKSLDRGNDWEVISPDLTTHDSTKIKGNVPHCTITTIAESPLRRGLIWVGTDDGKLWLTPDDGRTWKDLTGAIPDEVRPLWVSRVEPSRAEEGRCYVSYTGYREDEFAPHLFVTDDYGLTFRSLAEGLPKGEPVNVVRESPRNPAVLFVGTEFGAYASADQGATWTRLGKNLPRVAVHDLVVHPRDPEVVIGTHGRGIWIADVAGIEQWNDATTALLQPAVARRFPRGPDGGYTTLPRQFRGTNPRGVNLCAVIGAGVQKAELRVVDAAGTTLASYPLPNDTGLQVVNWNLTRRRTGIRGAMNRFFQGRGGRGQGRGGRGGFRGFRGGITAGTYRVELEVDGKVLAQKLEVR